MTNRVINDPSALGWEYDADTGRWTWGGGSGNGGGGGGGSFPEAPVDGKQYGRQNAGWTEIVSGGGGGDVNLDGYATESWVGANFQAKGNYLTPNDLNAYATKTWTQTYVSDNYQPKGIYLTTELDPVFTSSPAGSITQEMIDGWNSGNGGGDGGGEGGDGEGGNDTRISDTQISNWDEAYGWGETPSYVQAITAQQISDWDDAAGNGGGEDGPVTSVNGETGDVVLTPEIIGAEPEIETKNSAFNKEFGTENGTVAQGDASYTKSDSDTKYAQKSVTYTKAEGDARYSQKNDVYTKSESDAKYELKGAGGGADLGSYSFSGQDMWAASGSGARFSSAAILPLGSSGSLAAVGPDFGSATGKFKHAHFAGAVNSQRISVSDGAAVRIDLDDTSNATGKKYLRCSGGAFDIVNHDYSKAIFRVADDGDSSFSGEVTAKDFIAVSDERAKDNITAAPAGLIDSLNGREWDWKESGERGSGVVAQELEEVLPHLVHTDEEGMKSVAYNGLVAYLIEEVKALKAEVEALKS